MNSHKAVFKEELGKGVGVKVTLHVSGSVKPYFCRSRLIPHALRGKVELELQHLVEQGIIKPVETSEWAAPILAILKPD